MSSSPVLLRFSSPVTPTPGPAELRFGHAWSEAQSIYPQGSPAPNNGIPSVFLRRVHLQPFAIEAPAPAGPLIYNLRQFVRTSGYSASSYGSAWMSGGIKIVSLQGLADSHVNAPLVVNTTADQTAAPSGIQPLAVAAPRVSPRMLYAQGVPTPGLGVPAAQFPPRPAGFESSRYGRPVIEYKTKLLVLPGVKAIEPGFPRVFDPTSKVYPPSAAQVGIFGDTRLANRSYVVRPAGVDHLEIPIWTYLENTRRSVYPSGSALSTFGVTAINNATPSFTPVGWDAFAGLLGVGIGYSVRHVRPAGFYSTPFGLLVLAQPPSLVPEGIAGEMGEPSVWPRVRWVEATGSTAALFGEATVWFRSHTLAAEGSDAQIHGTAMVAHARRWLLARGAQLSSEGVPAASNADRTIAPASIFERFATGHAMGWARTLRPAGFDATRFGVRIIPDRQSAYPLGFRERYGLPTVFNSRKLVRPTGITTTVQPADRWGTARAWNLRQYVTMFYDADSQLNPPAWPQWTKVENRTRTVRITGSESLRIGDHQTDNKARPLLLTGIASPSMPESYEAGMVAFRVRPFRLEGIEAPYLSTWASVRNTAAVLKPDGVVATLFGNSAVANTRRSFDRIGGFDSAWYGYPMVADRVRTLSFEGRHTIGAPAITMPDVKLKTRYIDGIGFDAFGPGWASLSIHWTLITPRWTLQNLYGYATVRNVTPELHTRGRVSEEFGDAFVRLEWRPVAPSGSLTQLFGKTVIAFRDRSIYPTGYRAGAIGDKLTVVKTGAPPYSMQTINLDAEWFDRKEKKPGQGIPPPDNKDQNHIINQQVLYVIQEDPATKFGGHRVTANTIRVEPGYWEILVSAPIVTLKVRTLTVAQFPSSEVFDPEKPRLSPHTVYAVMEASEQARINHPLSDIRPLHYVDGLARAPGVTFGSAEVMLQNRVINARFQWIMPGYGRATVQLKRHYIQPTAFTTFRSGWHTVPGTQHVTQFDSTSMSLYGMTKIEHYVPPGPRSVKPSALNAQAFGQNRIDLFHRKVSPLGYEATLMGTRKSGDTPYMWQGLRVGPLMPTIPEGFGADLHGEQWISHRVREVHPAGFDGFQSEYQLEAFEQRMRVTRRAPSATIAARSLLAAGAHPDSVLGTPDVRPGVHFIRPDGNAEQFRKGAF